MTASLPPTNDGSAAKASHGRKTTYHGLNALRGVAAIAVMLVHVPEAFGIPLTFSGYLGVDLFFLMSGFVIADAYEARLRAGLTVAVFMKIRLLRFYPAYVLGLGFAALRIVGLAALHEPAAKLAELGTSFALALAFLPSPVGRYNLPSLYPLNAPTWSLAVELVINMLFAASCRALTVRLLWTIAAMSAALLIFFAFHGGVAGGWGWQNWWLGYVRASFSFPLGLLLHRFRHRLRLVRRLAPIAPVLLAAALVGPGPRWAVGYELVFVLVLSPMICAMATGTMPPWSTGLCTYLGRTSYPLYAIHLPLFILASAATRLARVPAGEIALLCIALLLPTCWYIDLIDERLRRRWSERFPRRSTAGLIQGQAPVLHQETPAASS